MPIALLLTSDSFRGWFNKTNEIVAALNGTTVVAGVVANGAFTVNGSLLVVNTFLANTTAVRLTGNTLIAANTVVNTSTNVFNFACGSLLIQPINGTTVNTSILFNAFATFANQVTFNANVSYNGDVTEIGNTLINGTTTANGGFLARQIIFGSANAMITPTALVAPQINDYTTTGLEECAILNLTPNIDCVLTGLAQPTSFVAGGRELIIQNLSTTYKVSLASANTSSLLQNRFKTPNDIAVDILPGGAAKVVWTSQNKEWRSLTPQTSSLTTLVVSGVSTLSGNTSIGGWLNVAAQLVVTGNSALTGNVTITGFANVLSTLQVTGNTALMNTAVGGTFSVAGLSTLTGNTTVTGFINAAATLQVAGNATFNGARLFANGQVRCDTTNGRLVLPVGANLWAT